MNVLPATAEIYGIEAGETRFGAALAAADDWADRLSAAGYGPGMRLSLLLENRPEFFLIWLGANKLGMSVVPINPDLRAAELEYLIGHAEPALIIATDARAPGLQDAADAADVDCKAVTLGADLPARSGDGAPNFLIAALKDPYSGNLDRVQVIKGWLNADGTRGEKVYDVAWSGDRTPGADGKLPSVGNTVDVANATWTNTIGAPELLTYWQDPDFDPDQRAFYYVRVLEIPTPRWTAYEAKRFQVEMTDNVPMTTTERAYSAPIWYTPG